MPGTLTALNITAGQSVRRGDVLATLEAMKMETAICSSIDAEVAEVLVTTGTQVNTHDLLIRLAG